MSNSTSKVAELPYTLKLIHIENFHCIKKAFINYLPPDCRWIFFAGANGSGKTHFLKALAMGVLGAPPGLLRQLQERCRIEVHQRSEEVNLLNTIEWNPEREEWSDVDVVPAYFCAYGVHRSTIQRDSSIHEKYGVIEHGANLLYGAGPLYDIEYWLKNQILREKIDPQARLRFQNVTELLERLMPNISKIELHGDRFFYWENGYKARRYELANSHQAILATFGDVVVRLSNAQPEEVRPKELTGIVVIDEFDLHLDPAYQRQLPMLLSEAFPRVQFICSVLGPNALSGAPEKSKIFAIERDEITGTTVREPGCDSDKLLSDSKKIYPLSDMKSIFPEEDEKSPGVHIDETSDYLKRREDEKLFPDEWFEDEKEL